MESTTAVQEPDSKAAKAAQPVTEERRRRRRAKISAQLHVKSADITSSIEEVCMSIDVSRDGLLFTARKRGYVKGQVLNVTFPYSNDAGAINKPQRAEVVRIQEQASGKYAVAVQFQTAASVVGAQAFGANAASSQGQTKQSMILAVEPDQRAADLMRNMFQQDGYQVVVVATAQEALNILRESVPAVFIAEVEATDMSGQDLCLIIKRNERLQRVPVILMTRSAQPADYTASHQMGAVVCMAKPFQPERLQHVVRLVAPPPRVSSAYGASRSMSNVERTL